MRRIASDIHEATYAPVLALTHVMYWRLLTSAVAASSVVSPALETIDLSGASARVVEGQEHRNVADRDGGLAVWEERARRVAVVAGSHIMTRLKVSMSNWIVTSPSPMTKGSSRTHDSMAVSVVPVGDAAVLTYRNSLW